MDHLVWHLSKRMEATQFVLNPHWALSSPVVVVVQSLSHVRLCDPTDGCTPGFPVLQYLLGHFKSSQLNTLKK